MLSSTSSSTAEHPPRTGTLEINAVSSDVLRSHILTRLDGASLAALSCTCSNLQSFCSDESLWKKQCFSTWPSVMDTRVQSIISTFPAGHRSFFTDSFPFLAHGCEIDLPPSVYMSKLVSAVDIFYKDEVIFSRVQVTETISGWFHCSPLRIDLIEPKETFMTRVSLIDKWEGDTWRDDLKDNLSLSWILIDPTRKHAANVSNRTPVSVHRHWLTGEIHIRFSTIFVVGDKRRSEEVEFMVTVVLAAKEKAEIEIREVSLVVEDMEGRNVGGKGGLVILAEVMGMKRRRREGKEEEGREKYREFMNKKTEKKEMKCRQEKGTNMETVACLIAVVLLGFLLCLYLFIHKNIVAILKKLK